MSLIFVSMRQKKNKQEYSAARNCQSQPDEAECRLHLLLDASPALPVCLCVCVCGRVCACTCAYAPMCVRVCVVW